MTSTDTAASRDTLISLIYRYLKDNGYKKVATALRKHAPQVETEEVKVSLSEIFKSWLREQKRHEKAGNHLTGAQKSDASESSDDPSEPPDVQTPELSPAIVNARRPKKPVKTNIRKTSASKKQMKKETVTKSRKRKSSASIIPEIDSDSDSSLDVDKWTKLVSQMSDSDIAKMEVLSNFIETPVSKPVMSTGKGRKTKQTKPKKQTNSAKNEKSKTAAKKTKAKTDHISVRTDKAKTTKKSAAVSESGKTPSKKVRGDSETSDLNVAETPKTTNARVHKHKPSENQTNGLMKTNKMATPSKETKGVGLSDSENVKTPKKVKVKSSHSLSEQVENHAKAVCDNDLETSSSQTLSKKAKKKVEILFESTNFKTPSGQPDNSLSGTKVKKKKNSSKLAEADCEDTSLKIDNALLMSDQSETPSKKNKKSKSVVEPVPSETPKKHKARKSECPIDLDMAKTSDVLQESSNIELHERLSEAEEAETPSKKSKKAKVRKSQAQTGDDDDNCGDDLDNEDTSGQDFKKHSKKRKHKREEVNYDLAPEEAIPEPKKAKKEKWKNKDAENIIEDHQQPSVEEPVEISQKKKKKKKKKERESENMVSDDPPVSTATEEVIVHKKKKKRKEKHFSRDEAPGLDDTQR